VELTAELDVWSTGCVMAELMLGQPLFPGESGIDQLVEIIKVLGTPTRDQIRTMNPNYMEHKFPQIKPHPFNKVCDSTCTHDLSITHIYQVFRKADAHAIDLISKLLEYTPTQRLSAIEAMVHPFFNELRDSNTKFPDSRHANGAMKELPVLFDFTHHGKGLEYVDLILCSYIAELSIAPHLNHELVPPHIRPGLVARGLDFESPDFRPIPKEQMIAKLD